MIPIPIHCCLLWNIQGAADRRSGIWPMNCWTSSRLKGTVNEQFHITRKIHLSPSIPQIQNRSAARYTIIIVGDRYVALHLANGTFSISKEHIVATRTNPDVLHDWFLISGISSLASCFPLIPSVRAGVRSWRLPSNGCMLATKTNSDQLTHLLLGCRLCVVGLNVHKSGRVQS